MPALPSLPPVLPSTACRPLRGEIAQRLGCGRIPVCLGAADSVLGAHGLGVSRRGQVAYIAGTSNVIMGVADRLLLDPEHRFLVTPLAEPGRWGLEMDLMATGSAISWLAGLFGTGIDEAALVALATGVDPRDAPLVLPYLSPGEQGALWDPLLRGAFVGLELCHDRRHLARGLVNGIVLESRRCLTVLGETGQFGREIKVAGGSAADPGFRADLADATRRRVGRPGGHDADCSARGAALLAALVIDGVTPGPGPAPPPPSPTRVAPRSGTGSGPLMSGRAGPSRSMTTRAPAPRGARAGGDRRRPAPLRARRHLDKPTDGPDAAWYICTRDGRRRWHGVSGAAEGLVRRP